nr:hypothetical protein [Hydrocarboniphaga sp.]
MPASDTGLSQNFAQPLFALNVNMVRLAVLVRVEKEAVGADAKNRWHSALSMPQTRSEPDTPAVNP